VVLLPPRQANFMLDRDTDKASLADAVRFLAGSLKSKFRPFVAHGKILCQDVPQRKGVSFATSCQPVGQGARFFGALVAHAGSCVHRSEAMRSIARRRASSGPTGSGLADLPLRPIQCQPVLECSSMTDKREPAAPLQLPANRADVTVQMASRSGAVWDSPISA
jgi:hypothetical protein